MQPNRLLGVLGEHEEDFPIERLALSRDRRYLASCSHDQTVKFWDALELCEVCFSFLFSSYTEFKCACFFIVYSHVHSPYTDFNCTCYFIVACFLYACHVPLCLFLSFFFLIQDDGAGAAAGAVSDDDELGAADVSGDDDGEDEDGMSEEEDEDARVAAALAAADARSMNVE